MKVLNCNQVKNFLNLGLTFCFLFSEIISAYNIIRVMFQGELLGRSLYDVIHPSDIDKVKGQISCVDLNPRHKLMGLKCK